MTPSRLHDVSHHTACLQGARGQCGDAGERSVDRIIEVDEQYVDVERARVPAANANPCHAILWQPSASFPVPRTWVLTDGMKDRCRSSYAALHCKMRARPGYDQ